jgi:hypothetical protein
VRGTGHDDPEWVHHCRRGELLWHVTEVFDGSDPGDVQVPGGELPPLARYSMLLDGAMPYKPSTGAKFEAILSRFAEDGPWWLTLPG